MIESAAGGGPTRRLPNPLIKKLEAFHALTDDEKRLLNCLTDAKKRVVAGAELLRAGEDPKLIHLVLEGLLCRYKRCGDGSKQVLAYMLPGDFCDLYGYILDAADHNLVAVANSVIVEITPAQVDTLVEHPRLKTALWWSTLVDASILREWIVNLGVRSAEKRIGHFFCEMMLRMKAVDLGDEQGFFLPLTQTNLADSLGLSLVHTNKSLQKLRARGLVTFVQGQVTIHEFKHLAEFSLFDPSYLHQAGPRSALAQTDLPS